MVWMKSFCFCCSVRLGVICSAIFSGILITLVLIAIAVEGNMMVKETVRLLENDADLNSEPVISFCINFMKNESDTFILMMLIFCSIHILTCTLAVFGAYKLKKLPLVPFIIMQFCVFLISLNIHVLSMIALKKSINLGVLIGATVIGGFFILWLGYIWASAVAFYQIINLVRSEKYKALYGDDPLSPVDYIDDQTDQDSVENVKMFSTPNYEEVENMKAWNAIVVARKKIEANGGNNNIATISYNKIHNGSNVGHIDENELRNFWHVKELIGFRKFTRNNPVSYY